MSIIGFNHVLVPHLLSIAKSVRQLVTIKLSNVGVLAGQDAFLLCFDGDAARPVVDIAEALSVRPSTISKMADILFRKGWIAREADQADGRRILIHLTAEGRAVADRVRTVHRDLGAELTDALGPDEAVLRTLTSLDAVLTKRLNRLR